LGRSLCVNLPYYLCQKGYGEGGGGGSICCTLLFSKLLISTYLHHLKLSLNFMFALSFGTIYFFEFSVLVKSMKNNEKSKVNHALNVQF